MFRHLSCLLALLLSLLWSPAAGAAPVITGSFSGTGIGGQGLGTVLFADANGGLLTAGRLAGVTANIGVGNLASRLGLTAGSLTNVGGTTFTHGSAISALFSGGMIGERIDFSFQAIQANISATPVYRYFVAVTQSGAGQYLQFLNPGLAFQASSIRMSDLDALGFDLNSNYRVSFGAIRTNPPAFLATYGTSFTLAKVVGVSTPEIDPTGALPSLTLLGCIWLAFSPRRRDYSLG